MCHSCVAGHDPIAVPGAADDLVRLRLRLGELLAVLRQLQDVDGRIDERVRFVVRLHVAHLVQVAEGDVARSGQLDQGRVDALLRSPATSDHGGQRRRHLGRRPGHQDRRRVGQLRVVAVALPGGKREAQRHDQRQQAARDADQRVGGAVQLQRRDACRRDRGVDLLDRGHQSAADVALLDGRDDHLIAQLRLRVLRQVGGLETAAGVRAQGAVLEGRVVEAEQDDEAVVESRASDAPFVHQPPRIGQVRIVPHGRRHPGVDHQLGAGAVLDRVDPRLEQRLRLRVEGAGLVVDRLVDDRIGERQAAAAEGANRERQAELGKRQHPDGDDRPEEAAQHGGAA